MKNSKKRRSVTMGKSDYLKSDYLLGYNQASYNKWHFLDQGKRAKIIGFGDYQIRLHYQ